MITLDRFKTLIDDEIAKLMADTETMKIELQDPKSDTFNLKYSDKKYILTELSEIKNISFEEENREGKSEIYIDLEEMYNNLEQLDTSETELNRIISTGYNTDDIKKKYIIQALWNLGLIRYKISESRITINVTRSLRNGSISFSPKTVYSDPNRISPHDNGYNCWGGWGPVLLQLFSEDKVVEGLQSIVHRMKQFNLEDSSNSFSKLTEFHYEKEPFVRIDSADELGRLIGSFKILNIFRIPTVIKFNITEEQLNEVDQIMLNINFLGDFYHVMVPKELWNEHVDVFDIRNEQTNIDELGESNSSNNNLPF